MTEKTDKVRAALELALNLSAYYGTFDNDDLIKEALSELDGCDYMSFSDAQKLFQNYIDCEMRDPCGLNDTAKAMLAYWRMVDSDALRKVREALAQCIDNLAGSGYFLDDYKQALSELDKMIGGGE